MRARSRYLGRKRQHPAGDGEVPVMSMLRPDPQISRFNEILKFACLIARVNVCSKSSFKYLATKYRILSVHFSSFHSRNELILANRSRYAFGTDSVFVRTNFNWPTYLITSMEFHTMNPCLFGIQFNTLNASTDSD